MVFGCNRRSSSCKRSFSAVDMAIIDSKVELRLPSIMAIIDSKAAFKAHSAVSEVAGKNSGYIESEARTCSALSIGCYVGKQWIDGSSKLIDFAEALSAVLGLQQLCNMGMYTSNQRYMTTCGKQRGHDALFDRCGSMALKK